MSYKSTCGFCGQVAIVAELPECPTCKIGSLVNEKDQYIAELNAACMDLSEELAKYKRHLTECCGCDGVEPVYENLSGLGG